ncbi:MAG: threonine synthase [Gammaproteobacteria bacterium]|nr:threonine synthase [Gammaproteobacteria bacterium]
MNNISYVSTRGSSDKLNFRDVVFEGLATDGGLYIPDKWPKLDIHKIDSFSSMSYQEIAYEIIKLYVDDSLSKDELKKIISESYCNFDHDDITPLIHSHDNQYFLELYHGPTYAFKDIAMQFISRLMGHYLENDNRNINILGATSGDTGAAAIEGFKNITSAKIFILHPHNKISEVQRKFMTTIESNSVHNIAIKGSFDDCQNIIKKIFSDTNYKISKNLTAINSINWARIMCQIVYYFYAMSRLPNNKNTLFSVPTGNFGDIFAGYVAKKMGLDIKMFNIATNENDILTRTLQTGIHALKNVKETSSPSIDIQISSNFERLLYDITKDSEYVNNLMHELKNKKVYNLDESILHKIRQSFVSNSVSETNVRTTISNLYNSYNLVVDPHTAVGYTSSIDLRETYNNIVTLSTAHPAKFKDTVVDIINNDNFVTKKIHDIINRDEKMTILENDVSSVQKFINTSV